MALQSVMTSLSNAERNSRLVRSKRESHREAADQERSNETKNDGTGKFIDSCW